MKIHIPKRAAMALLAGVSIAGVAGASAATLGTFSSSSLGSGDSVVASCDSTGIGINYTTSYNATSQKYLVTAVNFTSVDPLCTGLMASVSLRNNTTALFTSVPAAATVVSTSFSIAVSPAVEAGLVNGASLIITG